MENPTAASSPTFRESAEKRSRRTVHVDPLRGATVRIEENGKPSIEARQSWGTRLPLRVGSRRSTATADYSDNEVHVDVASLINNPGQFEAAVTPLPITRGDTSEVGTRGLRAMVEGIPDRIVCFSGVGVVRTYKSSEHTRPEIVIETPRPSEPVSSYMQVGTAVVDAAGNIWTERNETPFGAYDKEGLAIKLDRTRTFGQEFGPRVISAGSYEGTDMGWMVYDLPADVLTPPEALALELRLPKEYQGSFYGQAVEQLFQQTKALHDQGVVHMQLHPGNWFVRFDEGGKAQVFFTDWETATRLDQLPSESEFSGKEGYTQSAETEHALSGLTPQQKAIAFELYNAFSSATLIQTRQVADLVPWEEREQLSVNHVGEFSSSRQSVDYQLLILAHSLTAYLQGDMQQEAVQKIYGNLLEQYTSLAMGVAESGKIFLRNKGDLTELADKADGGDYAVKYAMEKLKVRLAKVCASTPAQDLYQNLLVDGSILDIPLAT